MAIEICGLSFGFGQHSILQNVNLSIPTGELTFLLGTNGAGKSTLFRCIMGLLTADAGEIRLHGKAIATMSRREIAGHVAYIPQVSAPNFDFSVLDVVVMGMAGSLSALSAPNAAHEKRAQQALEQLSIAHLARRGYGHISGGERQLVLLARALVQGANILLLDEPTANLDFGNQHRILALLRQLAGQGYTILLSSHDPNQTLQYGHKVVLLQNGTISCWGKPTEILTGEVLSKLYGLDISIAQGRAEVGIAEGIL